jgi:aspartyl-tRNA(Asn)/glutamyl-tRNA(Gln) amidotransferase subunit A
MTADIDQSAAGLFRDAVRTARSYRVAEDREPLFAPPPAQLRFEQAATGEVRGAAGDLWALGEDIGAGVVSVADTASRCRRQIDAHGVRLHAFEYVAPFEAAAAQLDLEAQRGGVRGPLFGIPVSIKDVIDVEGMPTSGSSLALEPRVARGDATAVARLREAGALIVGKSVTHEFALGVTTPQSRNPWDESRVPGGSSGGSAISIVTGMAAASLGTDTRASIRVPAALTGLVGFKPSYGVVPVDRWLTLSWSMDHFAPMARSVRDIALMMDVLCASESGFRSALPGGVAGKTFSYSPALVPGAEPAVAARFDQAVAALEDAGAAVVVWERPSADDLSIANAAGMVVSRAEAAQYHRSSGTDIERCTPEVRDQLTEAMQLDAVGYVHCLRLRGELRDRLLAAFEGVDVMIMPTSKVAAPKRDDAGRYLLVLSENCIPWSFVGFPAISICAGTSDGLPIGVQLVARPGHDAALLQAAYGLERLLPPAPEWSQR